jgi:hypothetical protein
MRGGTRALRGTHVDGDHRVRTDQLGDLHRVQPETSCSDDGHRLTRL